MKGHGIIGRIGHHALQHVGQEPRFVQGASVLVCHAQGILTRPHTVMVRWIRMCTSSQIVYFKPIILIRSISWLLWCLQSSCTARWKEGFQQQLPSQVRYFMSEVFSPSYLLLANFRCRDHCSQQGYLFYGLRGSSQCWCGNNYPDDSRMIDESSCDKNCPGDSSFKCGGQCIMNIYLVEIEGNLMAFVSMLAV